MHIRRLVKSGAASHTISLPKSWLDKNNLSRGDIIYINENSDKELLITPEAKQEEKETKEITINIDKKDLGSIQREITSAYINNYSSIIILGSELDTKVKDIRRILHDFVALEISELTSSKIVAKDLLNINEISVDKTIRRMDMIIRSVLQDSIQSIEGKNMYESVYHRDFDINKLYFLMFRILKGSLNNSKIGEAFGITNGEALSNWYLSLNLENIADNGKEICMLLKEDDSNINKKNLTELYKEVEAMYLRNMKAYFNNDKKLANEVAFSRTEIMKKCDEFMKNQKKAQGFNIIWNLKDMVNNICNISRIVIDS